MRVLFLQRQPCIRALKYAHALRGTHPEITIGFAYQGTTLTEWYGSGDELFSAWWRIPVLEPGPELASVISAFRPDVIHSHNLPDALTVEALQIVGGSVPVIHDCHDMQSLRQTPYEDGFPADGDPGELEARAVEGCDALIVVSDEMLAELRVRHRLPASTLEFANYALERDVAGDDAPGPPPDGPLRVVYQGSLSINGSHYDLREHFTALAAAGIQIDIFPNREAPEYGALATRTPRMQVMRTLPPAALMRALPAYDIGWASFNSGLNDAHLDTALPNKAFEYLASGLPIAAGRHHALVRLVEQHGVGVVIDDPADLPRALRDADPVRLRRAVAGQRHRFTVEGRIESLVKLYREAISGQSVREHAQAAEVPGPN